MKPFCFILILFLSSTLSAQSSISKEAQKEKEVGVLLDRFHKMAAEANFQEYFKLFAKDSEFIGTDALETWNKEEFMAYAKPYFDKGRGWSYFPLKRTIHLSEDSTWAWFSEVLESHYGLCRGSGVLEWQQGEWKLRQYVLSLTVPNSVADQVVEIKSSQEALQKEKLK
ncbi:nuclear transport factor 2 family protein [Chryseobacterium sp. A301]